MSETGYEQFKTDERPTEDSLKQLTNLAAQLDEAERAVANAEEAVKKAKARERDLAEHQIPELMETIGMADFKTTTGLRLQLKSKIRCGKLSNLKNPDGMRWLEDHNHDGLVKRTFTILFGKEDRKWANKFAADLRKRKKPLDSQQVEEVHAATLASFLEKQVENGEDIPLDLFGAFKHQRASIVRPKKGDL